VRELALAGEVPDLAMSTIIPEPKQQVTFLEWARASRRPVSDDDQDIRVGALFNPWNGGSESRRRIVGCWWRRRGIAAQEWRHPPIDAQ